MFQKVNRKIMAALLACNLYACFPLGAQVRRQPTVPHGELSVGWGDQMFEKLCWHPANDAGEYKYTQHWFIRYLHCQGSHLSYGGMIDVSGVFWDDYFLNVSVMPMARYNFYDKRGFSISSQCGFGINMNTGSETDYFNKNTEFAPVIYFSPVGIQYSRGRYFASIDLGGTFSLKSRNMIFMFGSRLISISIGIKI